MVLLKKHFKVRVLLISLLLMTLTACGFHMPNRGELGSTIKEINVSGSYHTKFYKIIVHKLENRGIKVHAQSVTNRQPEFNKNLPSLTITSPGVVLPIVSVNAFGATKEYNEIITSSVKLTIPNRDKPILIRCGITRYTLDKGDNTLASTNERAIMYDEALEELSDQTIRRISYLGKQTDPNAPYTSPAHLLLAKDENNEDVLIDNSPTMSLIDALMSKDEKEKDQAKSVELSELNNGIDILNSHKTYQLPKVKIRMVNEPPEEVSAEGFMKQPSN